MKLKDKLKEIVQRMIAGGCNLSVFLIESHKSAKIKSWHIGGDKEKRIEVNYFEPNISGSCSCFDHITLPQLLASPDAMKALINPSTVCEEEDCCNYNCLCKKSGCDITPNISECPDSTYYEFKRIGHKALDIIWDEGEQAAIDYLWEKLPKDES
jgi:hypothetical protein